jgi:hypothetical protein
VSFYFERGCPEQRPRAASSSACWELWCTSAYPLCRRAPPLLRPVLPPDPGRVTSDSRHWLRCSYVWVWLLPVCLGAPGTDFGRTRSYEKRPRARSPSPNPKPDSGAADFTNARLISGPKASPKPDPSWTFDPSKSRSKPKARQQINWTWASSPSTIT